MTIGFLGGDGRMAIAADAVRRAGFGVTLFSPERDTAEGFLRPLSALVLPYPVSRDGMHVTGTALSLDSLPLPSSVPLIGGRIPDALRAHGGGTFDAEENEPFLQRNAYLTAAAGIAAALRATARAFLDVRVAVLGYGRIGSRTAAMAKALGAHVTVLARRAETVTHAIADGFFGTLLTESIPIDADVLFGTVPAPAPLIEAITVSRGALVYDLGGAMPASLPDKDGEPVPVTALRGAPGVFAPTAAGEAYGDAILDILNTHIKKGRPT